MANAIQAVLHATEVAPKNWLSNTLDSILEDGDDIYTNILETSKTQLTFLTLDDIPISLAVISNTGCGPVHGESEGSFINLNSALVKLTSNASRVGLIFTMGKGSPSYSSAIIKSDDMFYFFDPHSRNDCGMQEADGTVILTEHKSIEALCIFVRHLAASLHETGSITYEIA